QGDQTLRPVRIAALIVFVSVAVFLPIDAHYSPAGLHKVLVAYGAHTTLALAILLVSLTRWGARRADPLALTLGFGAAANTLLYVHLWPRNPMLVATSLVCLLMGCAVVFSWSAPRMILLGAFVCVGFAIVSSRATAAELGGAPVVSAVGALGVGALIAIAGAGILGRARASLAQRQAELAAFSARLMAAQEEERRRLARELHDELGQAPPAVNAHTALTETALYRITQEALTNVARHAGAHRVRVALTREHADLKLEIADDGHGLPLRQGGTKPGTGLVGIRERVHALGGTVTLSSESGVRISVRVPLPD